MGRFWKNILLIPALTLYLTYAILVNYCFSCPCYPVLKPSPSDNLTIIVEPSSGIMRVTWARPLLTAGLIDSYCELLEVAAQASCRFWHFDLRTRIKPAATFTSWFTDTFAPLTIQRLGSPVYVAYWLGNQHKTFSSSLTANMQQELANAGFHPAFFDKELEARTWLLHMKEVEKAGS